MGDLRSAPIPPLSEKDHVRGPADAPVLIEYADLECPYCAVLHARLVDAGLRAPLRLAFRHFPVRSAHPRSWAAACAVEAAALQARFWEMHDAILEDQAHIEDPHLWARAQELGLDLERFDHDRHSDEVVARVQRGFMEGVRGGVVTTPTVFFGGGAYTGDVLRELVSRFGSDR